MNSFSWHSLLRVVLAGAIGAVCCGSFAQVGPASIPASAAIGTGVYNYASPPASYEIGTATYGLALRPSLAARLGKSINKSCHEGDREVPCSSELSPTELYLLEKAETVEGAAILYAGKKAFVFSNATPKMDIEKYLRAHAISPSHAEKASRAVSKLLKNPASKVMMIAAAGAGATLLGYDLYGIEIEKLQPILSANDLKNAQGTSLEKLQVLKREVGADPVKKQLNRLWAFVIGYSGRT